MPAVGTCPPDPSTGKSLVPPSNCNQKRILLFRLAGGAPAAGAAANQQAGDTCREQREIRRHRYGRSPTRSARRPAAARTDRKTAVKGNKVSEREDLVGL